MMITTMATVVTYPTPERRGDRVCHEVKQSLGAQEISSLMYPRLGASHASWCVVFYGVPSISNQSMVVRMALEVCLVVRDSIYDPVSDSTAPFSVRIHNLAQVRAVFNGTILTRRSNL